MVLTPQQVVPKVRSPKIPFFSPVSTRECAWCTCVSMSSTVRSWRKRTTKDSFRTFLFFLNNANANNNKKQVEHMHVKTEVRQSTNISNAIHQYAKAEIKRCYSFENRRCCLLPSTLRGFSSYVPVRQFYHNNTV
jgi:hypothetical protein